MANEYMYHHVFLPQKLPQKDDFDVCHEQALFEFLLASLERFKSEMVAPHARVVLDTVLKMVRASERALDTAGQISPTGLIDAFKGISVTGHLFLHIQAQNAGLLISNEAGEVVIEAFELSPRNEDVVGTKGRLRRSFPSICNSIDAKKFGDKELQSALARSISTLSHQVYPEMLSITKKAGSKQAEIRDTADPHAVTEFLMGVIQALGQSRSALCIEKMTRDEVFWDNSLMPWRRSPMWLLIRVSMHLVFARSDLGQLAGAQLYKSYMIFLHAGLLEHCIGGFESDMIHTMMSKTSRRLFKWQQTVTTDDSGLGTAWIDRIEAILRSAKHDLDDKWTQSIEESKPFWSLSELQDLDFALDTRIHLPELDNFLDRIAARSGIPQRRSWNPTGKVPHHETKGLPSICLRVRDEYTTCQLVAFESWVECNLEGWLITHTTDPYTCCNLKELIDQYYRAVTQYATGNPERWSKMVLTILQIWVACDKSACAVHPLLRDYQPEVPIEPLQSMLLLTKADMSRLVAIESYIITRYEGARDVCPPVFGSFGDHQSFAVRYFQSSRRHQDLKIRIEHDADASKTSKIKEYWQKKEQHERLMQEYGVKTCEYYEVIDDLFNDIRRDVHSGNCRKCRLKSQASHIKIHIHEWPLPNGTSGNATVFELDVPSAFGAWREATLFLVHDILKYKHARNAKPNQTYSPQTYENLRPYFNASYTGHRRITPVSEAKPFIVTHYKAVHITQATATSICKRNALQYGYCDMDHMTFTSTFVSTDNLFKKCSYQLPVVSSQLQQFLTRPPSRPSGVPHNGVLASQDNCPEHISLNEFKSFGTLPCGDRLQWLNILKELAAPVLDFSKLETRLLILQVLNQVGRRSDGVIERISHALLTDEDFGDKLLSQLEHSLRNVEENWKSYNALAIFVHIVVRLLSLAQCQRIRDRCLTFLEKARQIALRWTTHLQTRIFKSIHDDERSQFTSYAAECALVCAGSFDIEQTSLHSLLSDQDTLCVFLQCAITIQETRSSLRETSSMLHTCMLDRWEALLARVWTTISDLVLHHDNRGLDMAVRLSWHDYLPSYIWESQVTHRHWLSTKTETTSELAASSFVIHFNLITGELLVNGSPLARLSREYEQHSTYALLFGSSVVQVRPSPLPGMEFSSKQEYANHMVHFGLQTVKNLTNMFVVARTCEHDFEFVPRQLLANQLPTALSEDYVHWYDRNRKIVQFRLKDDPWSLKAEWELHRAGREWKLRKLGFTLVSPASNTALVLARILSSLDNPKRVHILYDEASSSLEIHLPRLRLSFSLRHGSTSLRSRDLRGMSVSTDQDVGTLIGLRNMLVLQADEFDGDRQIIIPDGEVSYLKAGNHISVTISEDTRTMAHLYQVDTELGRLIDKGSLHSQLFLCYLHAVTSHCCPDPLTRRTGAENALTILASAAVRSFDTLSDDHVATLISIMKLAPRRVFYPPYLRMMQTVKWNAHLALSSQHDRFGMLAEGILQQWQSQRMFHPWTEFKMPQLGSDSHLTSRDLIRASTFRVDGYGAEEFTTKHDVDYSSRAPSNCSERATRAFQTASMVITEQQFLQASMLPGIGNHLWNKLKDGDAIPGPDGILKQSELDMDPSWLHDPWITLRSIWCRLHKSFYEPDRRADKFTIMLWLAWIAFSKRADILVLQTMAALYNGLQPALTAMPVAVSLDLAQGDTVNKLKLNNAVTRGLRSIQQCQHMWSRNALETEKSFKKRRKREFDNLQNEATRDFVSYLENQWPCQEPNAPSVSAISQVIDVSAVMWIVRDQFMQWHQNRQFHQRYLGGIETSLSAWLVQKPLEPDRGRMELFALKRADKASVNTADFFARPAPTSSSAVSSCLDLVTDELCESDTTGRLRALLADIERTAEGPCEKSYVTDLRKSFSALSSVRKRFVAEYDPVRVEQDLKNMLNFWVGRVNDLYQNLCNTARHISQGLRISPIFLLEQLRLKQWEKISPPWKLCIHDYAVSLVKLQRARRLLSLCHKPAEFAEELINEPHQNWDPLSAPELLLLEIESGIVIRAVQEDIAREMRATTASSRVMQLNMGEGKSSVIVPMAVITLSDGTQLVRIIVPKPQSRQLFQMLRVKLGGLLSRRIYHLPVSRALKLEESQAAEIERMCRECISNKGVLLVQPEHVLSLKLMALDCLHAGKTTMAKLLLGVQHLFYNTARDVIDESDENFSVKFELVYTMGTQTMIDFAPDRWRVILAVLGMVPDCARRVKSKSARAIEIEESIQGHFPKIRLLDPEANAMLIDGIATQICRNGFQGLPVASMTNTQRRLICNYILDTDPSPDVIDLVQNGGLSEVYGASIKQTLMLLRGLLCKGVLAFTFSVKRWRVHYGPDPSRRPDTRLVVPYRAKDCPTPRSEFSHPDVVIILTTIHFYYAGLTNEDLFLSLTHLLKSDQAHAEYLDWVKTAPTLPQAFQELVGVNIHDRHQCIDTIFPHLRYATGVINYFLQYIVFPKAIREFPHKLSASGWDLAGPKAHGTTGFSGTNDSRYLLPLGVEQLDLKQQQHTNALVLQYLLKPENTVQLLGDKTHSITDAEHLLRTILDSACNARVILDVGAQVLELSNQQVAELWLRMTAEDSQTKAVVFVDENDEICVIDRYHHVARLQSSPLLAQLDTCLVYLDEAHTRGIDLRLPRHYRAAVTLGASLTKDRLVQGKLTLHNLSFPDTNCSTACMRLRKLGQGQSVTFFVPDEIRTKILRLKHDSCTQIHVEDILHWSIAETFVEIKRSIPLWAQQGFRYERNQAVWETARSREGYNISPGDVGIILEHESQTLEERYAVSNPQDLASAASCEETYSNSILQIQTKCAQYRSESQMSAALQEEQERELAPEIEEQRQIERPPAVVPEKHSIHADVRSFLKTGVMKSISDAFLPAFSTLASCSASVHFDVACVGRKTFVTKDFNRTIRSSGMSDPYFRLPQWIVTAPDAKTDHIDFMVVLSPHEAQELLPTIETNRRVTLHLYAPRIHQTHQSLDTLDLFTVGRAKRPNSIPTDLIWQLNIFSGQTYVNDYLEYEQLSAFVGRPSRTAIDAGAVPSLTLHNGRPSQGSLVDFIRVLVTKIRRDCENIDKTHLGKILHGIVLTEQDFEG